MPVKNIVPVLRLAYQAFADLKSNDPVRMAAATAFFSLFALPPIVIILSQLYSGLISGADQRISMQLFVKLAELLGTSSARRIQDISQHLQQRRSSEWLTALSVVLLVLSSTTMFTVIKSSLNQLWRVKPAANRPIGYILVEKAICLGIILVAGFLFWASLTLHQSLKPWETHWLVQSVATPWSRQAAQHLESTVVLTVWLALIFKFLPDVKIRWSSVWVGALVTGLLLIIGEQLLHRLLIKSGMSSFFGTSGALLLILLFAFYASLIFYYGASFTRSYTLWRQLELQPGIQAVAYQIKELDPSPDDAPKSREEKPLHPKKLSITNRLFRFFKGK